MPLAVTLVELLVALSVLAVISVAVTFLLAGAGRTHKYVNDEIDALAQVENAYRRILHNVRCAQAMTGPATAATPTATSTPAFTITTQPDPSYGGASAPQPATVTYYVQNGNLVEYDPRYNAGGTVSTLVNGVGSFTVLLEAGSAVNRTPSYVTISIASNSTPAITRTVRIACRNY
jgi:type II secretory pathway pseudopilin PulG